MSDTRHIVIAGGSSGIGRALVESLAADGQHVYVCARRKERLEELTTRHPTVWGWVCDVSREDDVVQFAAEVRKRTEVVDSLVNCAGGFGVIGPATTTASDAWMSTISTNLLGTLHCAKHFVSLMRTERRPSILNFSGGGAFGPFPRYSAYAASKAAVVSLTENLSLELAPLGIRVNAIAPGFVDTEIHQATLEAGLEQAGEQYGRTRDLLHGGGAPVPIAVPVECARFLLSDAAGALTGKTISARFDPWRTPEFQELIPLINKSDLYALRRLNADNLPEGELRARLGSGKEKTHK